jgi:hypothetical protein
MANSDWTTDFLLNGALNYFWFPIVPLNFFQGTCRVLTPSLPVLGWAPALLGNGMDGRILAKCM